MRNFTKSLLALALMFVCVGGVKAQGWVEIYKIDYSDYTSYPFYVMGFTPTFVNGAMVDGGSSAWHQYFIADGIPTVVGGNYKVKALVKASAEATFNVNMGWGWDDGQTIGASVTIPQSNDFVEVEWEYASVGATSCNLVAQPGGSDKTIEWKEQRVYEPGVPLTYTNILTTNANLEGSGNSSFSVTEQYIGSFKAKIVSGENGTSEEGTHAIMVQSADDAEAERYAWDSQFFLTMPKILPTGTRFKISFDYKASKAVTVGTQWHSAPGSYVHWSCLGDVNFGTTWKTYEKTMTVGTGEGDAAISPYSIAFNLSGNFEATTFYLDNFKFEVCDDDLSGLENAPALDRNPYPADPSFTIKETGYATFSYNYPVVFDEKIESYVAVYNPIGYVELSPIGGAPANTAVILKTAYPDDYTALIKYVAAPAENDLKVSDGNVTGDGSTIYALGKKDAKVGFIKVKSGVKIPAGKAYLVITSDGARDFLGFDDDTTGIESVEQSTKADNLYFNLAGQRVVQPTKGLYIVNGKKVIIK